VAQDGDWDAVLVDQMACRRRRGCRTFTRTCLASYQTILRALLFRGRRASGSLHRWEAGLRASTVQVSEGIASGLPMGRGHRHWPESRTQPSALRDYFLVRSYELISLVFQGRAEGSRVTTSLDNITIAW